MSTTLQIGPLTIELHHKAIKHLHLDVLPPDGKVRVSAPLAMSETAIRVAIIRRLPWIKQQQRNFIAQPRQSERELVSGESHHLWGQRYRLEVIERVGRHEVLIKGSRKLALFVNPGTTLDNRNLVMTEWYRAQLKQRVPALLALWEPILGTQLQHWGIKKMKTKWGTCNRETSRIWLNLELAKKPVTCLEYILVHELIHLLERHHNARFEALMNHHLPNWRESRALLKDLPLGHDTWKRDSH
ncbi:M48 family metallopeptidase [Aeromonas molluscorum]|uniref:YgjP-like metallopeptidase domain-containing protein n=1 Tax=Aeromonas molluscorum 848 TaxID=1268236 RepID=R1F6Y9_9GAMM|nr:SprT family zinc-dependent metalloprotease [Aeromonas molluscorum]EOD55558.1 hypothetical protein G113_08315 [Aeromonas molluscorum 848]